MAVITGFADVVRTCTISGHVSAGELAALINVRHNTMESVRYDGRS